MDVEDDFMAFSEDNEDNDDEPQETSTNKAVTSAESNGAISTAVAVSYAVFTGTRFPRPMAFPRIRDRPVNLEKILTQVVCFDTVPPEGWKE